MLQRVEDMIYKEANIFFPNCALNFTEEEWFGIYRDSKDYPVCFGVEMRHGRRQRSICIQKIAVKM